jgi:hypothetical protein
MLTAETDTTVTFPHWRAAWALLFALSFSVTLTAGDTKPKPPVPPKSAKPGQKAAQQQAAKTQAQAANQSARAAQQALNAQNLPPGLALQRLSQMSPEERAQALSSLPPKRQENIEKMVENYSKETPEQQAREQHQEARMAALPPLRRAQVRQSLADLNAIQPPRKGVILLELNKLGGMTEEQRANYMSKPAFRKNFSGAEIQLMDNLHGIVP